MSLVAEFVKKSIGYVIVAFMSQYNNFVIIFISTANTYEINNIY